MLTATNPFRGETWKESEELTKTKVTIHRPFIYKGDTSTHSEGTDPRVALGA